MGMDEGEVADLKRACEAALALADALGRRRDDLLAANNSLLERARRAEALVAKKEAELLKERDASLALFLKLNAPIRKEGERSVAKDLWHGGQ